LFTHCLERKDTRAEKKKKCSPPIIITFLSFHGNTLLIPHHTPHRPTAKARSRLHRGIAAVKEMVRFLAMNEAQIRGWVKSPPGCVDDRDDGGKTPLYVAAGKVNSVPLTK